MTFTIILPYPTKQVKIYEKNFVNYAPITKTIDYPAKICYNILARGDTHGLEH